MARKLRTIREIIEAAGGAPTVASALQRKVTPDAVYKWYDIGIPDRHWPTIMPMADATAAEMLAANISARTQGTTA